MGGSGQGGGAGRDADGSVRQGDDRPSTPQGIEDNCCYVPLCLDTQVKFALPERDFRVEASVSGWNNRLQQSRLAAPGCRAFTPGRTRQLLGMCTYRQRIVFLVFRSVSPRVARFWERSSFLRQRHRMGMIFCLRRLSRQVVSGAPPRPRGKAVAHPTHLDILRNQVFLNFRPSP